MGIQKKLFIKDSRNLFWNDLYSKQQCDCSIVKTFTYNKTETSDFEAAFDYGDNYFLYMVNFFHILVLFKRKFNSSTLSQKLSKQENYSNGCT